MAAPTVDATAKGASANSYVTRAEAQTYFDGRLDENDWEKMVNHRVVPVLLPGAVFFLGKEKYAKHSIFHPLGRYHDDEAIAPGVRGRV